MSGLDAIILAAGKGTRMKSARPKVLHEVGGKAMVERVLAATRKAGAEQVVTIIGFGADEVRAVLGDTCEYVVQEEQLGTGHAVGLTEDVLETADVVMVVCGDTPLLRVETLCKLRDVHMETGAAATVLTTFMDDPTGYGRVIRDATGNVMRIVEQKDATEKELAIKEINTGTYCFDGQYLWDMLAKVNCDNAQGEYYLTDVVGLLVAAGKKVAAAICDDADETLGVNSRRQLAEAEAVLRRRKNDELMAAGVTIIDPAQTYVEESVSVGMDTILEPGTILRGTTEIGMSCVIGPQTELENTEVGDNSRLHRVYAHDCKIGTNAEIGPYVHLRPGTEIYNNVRVGNFVEVKNSQVGTGSKLPHLSYVGDSDIGAGVNVGCGTITVNYDGKNKHRTTIKDGAFIGCNSNLIAPVIIGEEAYIGAGSTITKDVPKRALAVGRAKSIVRENWVKDTTFKK